MTHFAWRIGAMSSRKLTGCSAATHVIAQDTVTARLIFQIAATERAKTGLRKIEV